MNFKMHYAYSLVLLNLLMPYLMQFFMAVYHGAWVPVI